jgi:hypothetical protein
MGRARLLSSVCFALGLLTAASGCADVSEEDNESGGAALSESAFNLDVGKESAKEDPVLTFGHPSTTNMHSLAVLSSAAYYAGAELQTKLCEAGIHQRGTPTCRGTVQDAEAEVASFDTTADDHAIYIRTTAQTRSGPKDVAILSFRGTASNANIRTDANIFKVRNWAAESADPAIVGKTLPGSAHAGFVNAASRLWRGDSPAKSLRTFLEARHTQPNAPPLYITGHSLGGAVATVTLGFMYFGDCSSIAQGEIFGTPRRVPADQLAWTLPGTTCSAKPRMRAEALYTYGSPRVGDNAFAEGIGNILALRRTAHFRVVHSNDIITRIAPRFTGYTHIHLNIQGLTENGREYGIREDEEADRVYGVRPSGERVVGKCRQWKDLRDNPAECPTLSLAYLLDGVAAANRERGEILRLGGGATEALDDDRTLIGSREDHRLAINYIPLLQRVLPTSR